MVRVTWTTTLSARMKNGFERFGIMPWFGPRNEGEPATNRVGSATGKGGAGGFPVASERWQPITAQCHAKAGSVCRVVFRGGCPGSDRVGPRRSSKFSCDALRRDTTRPMRMPAYERSAPRRRPR